MHSHSALRGRRVVLGYYRASALSRQESVDPGVHSKGSSIMNLASRIACHRASQSSEEVGGVKCRWTLIQPLAVVGNNRVRVSLMLLV